MRTIEESIAVLERSRASSRIKSLNHYAIATNGVTGTECIVDLCWDRYHRTHKGFSARTLRAALDKAASEVGE